MLELQIEKNVIANRIGVSLEVADDAPGLGLKRGDIATVVPLDDEIPDALYVLKSGELAQMQSLFDGDLLRMTYGNAASYQVSVLEARDMIIGRITKCSRPIRRG